jgi:hypothetical protein
MNADGEAAVAAVRAHFWEITDSFLKHTQGELEMARAMNDREEIIRRQIKLEVMKHARYILDWSIVSVRRAGEADHDEA